MNIAIITAAGIGKRMHADRNKVLLLLEDKPILYHTINVFEESKSIDKIIIVSNKEEINEISQLIDRYKFKKIKKVVEGSSERQYSVHNGIKAIEDAKDDDILAIHNGANPFVDEKIIEDCIKAAKDHGAAVAAVPSRDTIKIVEDGFVKETLDRKKLWHMHTPQCIKYSIAVLAFEKAEKDNFLGTDDATLVERIGKKVKIVDSTEENIKITFPKDMEKAKFIQAGTKIGIGLDSHRFDTEKKELWLGGILIKDEQGLKANSDGDVILHSLFNALSSAIGERSISIYADDMCRHGIKDSKKYLKVIKDIVDKRDHKINNISIIVEGKKPKLERYVPEMKNKISELLDIKEENIGITLTTGEELTEFGKGLGIQVFSLAALIRR